jgi:hypothetical protein
VRLALSKPNLPSLLSGITSQTANGTFDILIHGIANLIKHVYMSINLK